MLYQSTGRTRVVAKAAGRAGFTLVETLATAGIILVIAAIVFPAGKALFEKSYQAKCTSNLRQLYLAVRAYGQDNNDRIIYSRGQRTGGTSPDWAPELAFNGYLDKASVAVGSIGSIEQVGKIPVFRCPAALANRRSNAAAATQYTYGFNANLSDAESATGTKTFAKLSKPSQTLMISEGSGTTGWYLNAAKLPNAEHGDKANILFSDGHVEMRDPKTFPSRATAEGKVFWDGVES